MEDHDPNKLTPRQASSLRKAADILVNMRPGEIVTVPNDGTFMFDMNRLWNKKQRECGTVGCILGLAHLIEQTAGRPDTWRMSDQGACSCRRCEATPDCPLSHEAYHLFFPGDRAGLDYRQIPPSLAGHATLEFLKTGTVPDFVELSERLGIELLSDY